MADCRVIAGRYTAGMKGEPGTDVWSRVSSAARMFVACLAGASIVACGPTPDSTREMRAAIQAEPLPAISVVNISDAELFELVKEQPAPEGEGKVTDWLERRLRTTRGQPLFPRWTAQRRAASRFEVRFTYTWVGLDNQIESRGYVWHVDGALSTVEGPKALSFGDGPRARSIAEQQQRRAEDPEYSLR